MIVEQQDFICFFSQLLSASINRCISKKKKENWDKSFPSLLFHYPSSPHPSTVVNDVTMSRRVTDCRKEFSDSATISLYYCINAAPAPPWEMLPSLRNVTNTSDVYVKAIDTTDFTSASSHGATRLYQGPVAAAAAAGFTCSFVAGAVVISALVTTAVTYVTAVLVAALKSAKLTPLSSVSSTSTTGKCHRTQYIF